MVIPKALNFLLVSMSMRFLIIYYYFSIAKVNNSKMSRANQGIAPVPYNLISDLP